MTSSSHFSSDPLPAYDYIVVGAGCEGSATAYQLARRGQRVLLLEQFSLPTTRGSSHGPSRITRRAYEHPIYTEMMQEAYNEWAHLESSGIERLYHPKGLIITTRDQNYLEPIRQSLTKHGNHYTNMSALEVNRRFGPVFRFPEEFSALFEPSGGILNADKCLQAFWSQIRKLGGMIHDEEAATTLIHHQKRGGKHPIVITTNRGRQYMACGVVLCLGAWASDSSLIRENLRLNLPLTPQKISVYYWETKDPTVDHTKLPCVILEDAEHHHYYGMPPPDAAGLYKFCIHEGPPIDPGRRDEPDLSWWRKKTAEQVEAYLPGLEPVPKIVDSCIYTWTPDSNFILDKHPTLPNVVIGAGFSGHGFKLSIVIGNILADLVSEIPPAYDMKMFRMDRFSMSRKAKL